MIALIEIIFTTEVIMSEYEQCFCANRQCKYYGLRGQNNIAHRGKYGKDKNRDLLYCRTCGKRFAATQASALFGLHLPAETIRQIIHRSALRCDCRKRFWTSQMKSSGRWTEGQEVGRGDVFSFRGRDFQRRCIQRYCSGLTRTNSSIARVYSCVTQCKALS